MLDNICLKEEEEMKYILSVMMLWGMLGLQFSSSKCKVDPYSSTGHDQFAELSMALTQYKLLVKYEQSVIDSYLTKVSRRVFGSSDFVIVNYGDARYVSTVIFSRSNKTRDAYTFTYNLDTVIYSDVSVSVKGSLSAKKVFKSNKGDTTVEGDVAITYATSSSIKTTESGKMAVIIHPGKKVSLRIVGDAKVSNGVSKYYFCGICTKKGSWEVVDVITCCFELLEENA